MKRRKRLEPIFEALAPGQGAIPPSPGREKIKSTAEKGFLYCGPSGAGHFVKMIHNGIEYGVMQAYAEGFDIMRGAASESLAEGYRYNFNAADIAELWRRGSVIGSWLLDLTAMALAEDSELRQVHRGGSRLRGGSVDGSGGNRRGCLRRSFNCGPLCAFSFPPGAHVRREDAVGNEKQVRRARGNLSRQLVNYGCMCNSSSSRALRAGDLWRFR